MADQSITQLPVAQTVLETDVTVLVQRGVTKQVAVTLLATAIAPGKLITNIVMLPNYDIEFFYSDGTTSVIGPIPGFTNAYINGSGHLILVETDGTLLDCGSAVGPSGYSGASGFSGFSGISGYSGFSGLNGGGGVQGFWGSFYDTTNQTASSTTSAYVMNIGSTDPNSTGVSIQSGNQIKVANAGAYDIQYSIQFANSDTGNTNDNVNIWLRVNGTDIADSNSIFTVPNSKGGNNGFLIATTCLPLKLNAGDYVQLLWAVNNTSISIVTTGAQSNPTIPVTPGVIVGVQQIMYTQSGYSGISGYSGYSGKSGYSGSGISGSPYWARCRAGRRETAPGRAPPAGGLARRFSADCNHRRAK